MAAMLGVWGQSAGVMAQAPVIYTQPESVVVGEGLPAVITAGASGFGETTYQWLRDGEPLEGATLESLYIPITTAADEGSYALLVENEFGEVTSQAAELRLVPRIRLEEVATITPPAEMSPGFAMEVEVENGRAYLASNSLFIYDVNDPANPVFLGMYGSRSSRFYSVDVEGTRAVISGGGNLEVIDVSNPALPVRLGRSTDATWVNDVILQGDFVYAGGGGIKIFNISALPMVTVEGELSLSLAYTIALSEDGEVAYLAQPSGGASVVDISDRTAPELVTTLSGVGAGDTVKVDGDYLYYAGESLRVYDISDPRNPLALGPKQALGRGFGANGMNVKGSFVFTDRNGMQLTEPNAFMAVYDASDPGRPIEVGRYEGGGSYNVEAVDVDGDSIYVAAGPNVHILRMLAATNAPVVVQEMGNPVVVAGTTAVLETHASGGEELGYQWLKAGVALEGETNRVLRIADVGAEDAGEYAVRIWNSVGEVTSAGSVSVVVPGVLEFSVEQAQTTPSLVFDLPEGLQGRVQGSFDLVTWQDLWSGQAGAEGVTLRDTAASNVGYRFYRLVYGVE